MAQLIHPHVMLFTDEGTFHIVPDHYPPVCVGPGQTNYAEIVCPRCKFLWLVNELKKLETKKSMLVIQKAGQNGKAQRNGR